MVGVGLLAGERGDGEGMAEAETAVSAMRQVVIEAVYFMFVNLM